MRQAKRQDDRLYVAKVVAAGATVLFLGGLLYIAIDRDMNRPYIPFVVAALLLVLAGLSVSVTRHVSRQVDEKLEKATSGLAAAFVIGGIAVRVLRMLLRIVRRSRG